MFFAGEVVEEGAFADVGGVGDVFDGGVGEALFGEDIESGAEQALMYFGAAPLAAIGDGEGGGRRGFGFADFGGAGRRRDLSSLMTVSHKWLEVKLAGLG